MQATNWLVRVTNKGQLVISWIIQDKSKADASREADVTVRGLTAEWDSWKILPIKKGVPEISTLRPSNKDDDYLISLVGLTGHQIKDIYGFVSTQFGDPVFEVTRIVFDNNKWVSLGGEHDIAYLESYREHGLHLDNASLTGLLMQDSDWDEREELDED